MTIDLSPGTPVCPIAQAIGHAVIQQGYRVLYRETHKLLEELADATLDGKRKEHMGLLTSVAVLIIDDLPPPRRRPVAGDPGPGNAQTAVDRRLGIAGDHPGTLVACRRVNVTIAERV